MRRFLIIAAAVVGALVIFAGAILYYAAANLNSIIAERRGMLLDKVSAAIGREVKATDIKASIGWGVSAQISGVTVADDPAISQQPFVQAGDVFAKLDLMPLLARRIEVTEIVLQKPIIRIIQTRDGKLNISTIGKQVEAGAPSKEPPSAAVEGAPLAQSGGKQSAGGSRALAALLVKNFSVEHGTVIYQQEGAKEGVTINDIGLHLKDFGFTEAFTVDLTAAAFTDQQNIDVSATIGPLMKNGAIDVNAIPLSVKLNVGPLKLAQLRQIPQLAKAIPPKLSIPEPVSADVEAQGTINALGFKLSADLSANQIAFGDTFTKPGDLPLKLEAQGSRVGGAVGVKQAVVMLGNLEMKASNLRLADGNVYARVDTNNFDLASLGKLLPALAKYNLTGKSEVHTDVQIAGGNPSVVGVVTLSDVGLAAPDQKAPPLSGLAGMIKLEGNAADVGPLNFNLGPAPATLKARVSSLRPVKLIYNLTAASLHLADLVPSRPPTDQMSQLTVGGNLELSPQVGPIVDAKILSPSGSLNNIAYQNLNLAVSLEGKRARVTALHVTAFSGELAATAETQFAASAPFSASVSFSNLDLQKALESQQSKAAGIVRGTLGGNANIAGTTGSFDEMKPTFKGAGKLTLTNAKLVGVNVGGEALKKVQNLPAIGNLVPEAVIARHPELFSNPDTDIQTAGLTFNLTGARITTHDLKVQTVDYSLLGDGWFDMDKNIDLAAQIVLAQQFSGELIAAQKNVQYLADRDGQIVIPLQITGQLPKPAVLPNVTQLAQTAGQRAVQGEGQKYIGKFLGKKGLGKSLGGILGGGEPGEAPSGGGTPAPGGATQPPPNPLEQLKKLF